MANNTLETTYLCKNALFKIKFIVIITFFSLGDIVNKVTLPYNTKIYEFMKKMQGTGDECRGETLTTSDHGCQDGTEH